MTNLQKWDTLLQVVQTIDYHETLYRYGLRFEKGELYIRTGIGTYHPLLDEFTISRSTVIRRLDLLPPHILKYVREYLEANCSTSPSSRYLYNLF
jgi:hypothetical protein